MATNCDFPRSATACSVNTVIEISVLPFWRRRASPLGVLSERTLRPFSRYHDTHKPTHTLDVFEMLYINSARLTVVIKC